MVHMGEEDPNSFQCASLARQQITVDLVARLAAYLSGSCQLVLHRCRLDGPM